jgi:hypothetical protein
MNDRYRKKPVVIDAVRWTGNVDEVKQWASMPRTDPKLQFGTIDVDGYVTLSIATLEGTMYASPGDWIIRGVKGELYPCKPDIFEATYEAYEPSDDLDEGGLEIPSAMLHDALAHQRLRHAGVLQALLDWYEHAHLIANAGLGSLNDRPLLEAVKKLVEMEAVTTLGVDERGKP